MENIINKESLKNLKTTSIYNRKSKIHIPDFYHINNDNSLKTFFDNLPDCFASKDLKTIGDRILETYKNNNWFHISMGSHVIKNGLNPIIIDLIKQKILKSISINGSGIIHDLEIALCGKTSENVEESIIDGSFGMTKETSECYSNAINNHKDDKNIGLGYLFGKEISKNNLKYKEYSILSTAYENNVDVTCHVAIGNDITHMHHNLNSELLGRFTYNDFIKFINIVYVLNNGVYMNIGSSVILPEIFLKATSIVKNLYQEKLKGLTTVNFDFNNQYRPINSVLKRPCLMSDDNESFNIIGHHELLIPLLYNYLMVTI